MKKTFFIFIIFLIFSNLVYSKPDEDFNLEDIKGEFEIMLRTIYLFKEYQKIKIKLHVHVYEDWGSFNASTSVKKEDDNVICEIILGKPVVLVRPIFRYFLEAHELSHCFQVEKVDKVQERRILEEEADYVAGKILCKLFGNSKGIEYVETGLDFLCFSGLACPELNDYPKFLKRKKIALEGCEF